jgi:hypothetical protein
MYLPSVARYSISRCLGIRGRRDRPRGLRHGMFSPAGTMESKLKLN